MNICSSPSLMSASYTALYSLFGKDALILPLVLIRTFSTRSKSVLLTLFKSIVLPHLDYGSQLWSPYKIKSINALEKVQRVFTKHIDGMHDLSYTERLKALQIYSLQRRRDRYMAIYIWKILEGNVPNFSPPIKCHISARRGRLCNSGVVPTGHLGTLITTFYPNLVK